MSGDNLSGVKGWKGKVADTFDRVPVKGPMAAVVILGGVIVAAINGGFGNSACDTKPLNHVYRPQRLQVVEKCAEVTGTVIAWRHEHDGDYHVNMKIDQDGWINAKNKTRQHGYTVVEFIPLEPRPKKFFAGQRLRIRGTKVLDKQHGGWIEMHPVFSFNELSPVGVGPNRANLAPPTED